MWRDTRVLVTGARGFIGRCLCRRLVASGAAVYGVSSQTSLIPTTGVTWLRADLSDLGAVRELIGRTQPDVIFHLAGHVTGSQDVGHVQSTFHANVTSTVHLLTVSVDARPRRVVLVGSMQEPAPEHPAAVPCSPYAASKWACSGYGRMFHALYGLPVVIARPMMVYGPGQWDLVKLLPYVTVSLLKGTSPAVGSGERQLDWIFVEDVVDGMLAVAMSPDTDGQTLDLGSGTLTSVRDIVEQIAALVDTDIPIRFGALEDRPFERPCAARIEQTRQAIGWSARTRLSEGLKQTVEWYRATWSSPQPT